METRLIHSGGTQTTQYLYGVDPNTNSEINSGELLREIHYPADSSGRTDPRPAFTAIYGYNALWAKLRSTATAMA